MVVKHCFKMHSFNIIIKSNDKASIYNFLHYSKEISKCNLNTLKKNYKKKTRQKKLTILKSPHVNKNAQEQFETKTFKKQLTIKAVKNLKYLVFLKNLISNLFCSIHFKVSLILGNNRAKYIIYNPNNFKIYKYLNSKITNSDYDSFNKFKVSINLKNFLLIIKNNLLLKIVGLYAEFLKYCRLNSSEVEQRTENPCDDSSSLSSSIKMEQQLVTLFNNIKNGQLSKRNFIYHRKKKSCEHFLKILWTEGYIISYKTSSHNPKKLKIFLKYNNSIPTINSLKLITKPGYKIYCSVNQIWKINSNKLFIIFSTNKGLKSIVDCKRLKIGGKPFIIIN